MALRVRTNGRIYCAALNREETGDTYVDDEIHYQLSIVNKELVTTPNKIHMNTNGEWWWKGREPYNKFIDAFYYKN